MKQKECIWDYPRPPALIKRDMEEGVVFNEKELCRTRNCYTICETSHPPTWYIPKEAFAAGVLKKRAGKQSFCEFKGVAEYFDVVVDGVTAPAAAWGYPNASGEFEELKDCVALYPAKMQKCTVDGEAVV